VAVYHWQPTPEEDPQDDSGEKVWIPQATKPRSWSKQTHCVDSTESTVEVRHPHFRLGDLAHRRDKPAGIPQSVQVGGRLRMAGRIQQSALESELLKPRSPVFHFSLKLWKLYSDYLQVVVPPATTSLKFPEGGKEPTSEILDENRGDGIGLKHPGQSRPHVVDIRRRRSHGEEWINKGQAHRVLAVCK